MKIDQDSIIIDSYGYVRVSLKQQEKGFSISAQIELLKSYAEKNNIRLTKIFIESETAKKAGRKEFNNMLAEIKQTGIKTVLVEKTDRLYRNFKDYVTLEDYDLNIHLIKESTILSKNSKSHEKLVHGFKVLIAKNYIDNLSEEVRKGLREKVNQGHYPQKATVGYKNVEDPITKKKIIIVDKEKAPFVKRLFELYASGSFSIEEIRKKLFQEGFNHNLKPYSKSRLLFALKDVFYIGKFLYKGVVYDGKHEPIIDVDVFNAVQKMFNHSKARSHDVEFAYTGLIRCEYCGCQLTAELKKGRYVYYHCTGKRGGDCKKDWIREEELEKTFLELISKIPDPEGELFTKIRNGIKEMWELKNEFDENSSENIVKQINRLKARINNLYTDKLDGKIPEEFWEEKHNLWYSEKETLLNKLNGLNNAARTFDEGTNLLANFCKYAPDKFLQASPKKKRQILNLIGSNFTYKDKKLSVELSSVFDLLINSSFCLNGAGDEARTRDIFLGKEAFYH